MRSCVDSSTRSKFGYCDEPQHLDPIAEYEDELDLDYGAEDDAYDETVDEEEYQYFDNDRYVIENRKRYVKPAKSREMHAQPTRAKYIYKKKEVESSGERTLRKPLNKTALSGTLSPVTSKSKVEPPRWNKSMNAVSSFQRGPKTKKPEGISALHSLNALREKMFGNLSKTQSVNTPTLETPATPSLYGKPKRRNSVATEQIHHDSGDGPRVSEPFKMNLSELLKITDESAYAGSAADNEVVANLVNDINTLQMDNRRKMNEMERQKQETDQYFPPSLNLVNFRQQMERKMESDQQQSSSMGYQPFTNTNPGIGSFSSNFLEAMNYPLKKHSSTQTNLGLDEAYSSEQVFKQGCEVKYDDACVQDDNDNQNWNADDVSNLVSSSKEDLTELRNLQKTKRMICELINKEIEKIAKMKNLDMSVSRRFLLQDHDSLSCSEDFRKTRLDTLNNLQNEIKKLITLETVDE